MFEESKGLYYKAGTGAAWLPLCAEILGGMFECLGSDQANSLKGLLKIEKKGNI